MTRDKHSTLYLVSSEQNDRMLLESVFREHEPALRKFLKVRLIGEHDREDFIQQLFLRLMQKDNLAKRISVQTGNTRIYLQTILNGMIVDMLRSRESKKADRHDPFDENELPAEISNPENAAMAREQLKKMYEILKKMDLKYRRVIVLNRFQHKSCRQISTLLGVSESTVERHLSMALALLREGLQERQSQP